MFPPEPVEGIVESECRPYPVVYQDQNGFPEELNKVNLYLLSVSLSEREKYLTCALGRQGDILNIVCTRFTNHSHFPGDGSQSHIASVIHTC